MIVLALGVPFLLIIFCSRWSGQSSRGSTGPILAPWTLTPPVPLRNDVNGSVTEPDPSINLGGHLWGCDRRGRPLQGGLLNGLARRERQRESS